MPPLPEEGLQRVVAQCVRMSESIPHHFLMLTSSQKGTYLPIKRVFLFRLVGGSMGIS